MTSGSNLEYFARIGGVKLRLRFAQRAVSYIAPATRRTTSGFCTAHERVVVTRLMRNVSAIALYGTAITRMGPACESCGSGRYAAATVPRCSANGISLNGISTNLTSATFAPLRVSHIFTAMLVRETSVPKATV